MKSLINKKGQSTFGIWGVLLLVGLLCVLLFVGFIFAFGSAVLNWTMDIAVPEFTGFGMVGSANASAISSTVLTPMNNLVQNMSWFGGVIYILGIIGILGLAFVYKATMQKWLIPLFFGLMVILVIICIFMSNIYESIYTGTDDLAVRLQEQGLLSYLILYSPLIMTLIGFIGGAIMFSGAGEENG